MNRLLDSERRDAAVITALTTMVAAKIRWGFWKCCGRLRLDVHALESQTGMIQSSQQDVLIHAFMTTDSEAPYCNKRTIFLALSPGT